MLPLESIPIPNFAHFGILSQINFGQNLDIWNSVQLQPTHQSNFRVCQKARAPRQMKIGAFANLHITNKSNQDQGNKKRRELYNHQLFGREGRNKTLQLHNGQRSVKTFSISSYRAKQKTLKQDKSTHNYIQARKFKYRR